MRNKANEQYDFSVYSDADLVAYRIKELITKLEGLREPTTIEEIFDNELIIGGVLSALKRYKQLEPRRFDVFKVEICKRIRQAVNPTLRGMSNILGLIAQSKRNFEKTDVYEYADDAPNQAAVQSYTASLAVELTRGEDKAHKAIEKALRSREGCIALASAMSSGKYPDEYFLYCKDEIQNGLMSEKQQKWQKQHDAKAAQLDEKWTEAYTRKFALEQEIKGNVDSVLAEEAEKQFFGTDAAKGSGNGGNVLGFEGIR